MNSLHVAWQQPDTREWIPVATLRRKDDIYRLNFSKGALRANGFSGFGSMNVYGRVYESPTLFPFFSNRLINRTRPEYGDYMKWMCLDEMSNDPLTILSVTGGIRATDSIELIPDMGSQFGNMQFDFFPRSLNHLPKQVLCVIEELNEGDPLYLLHDVQNIFDACALAIRTKTPATLVGYCAKYYTKSLLEILSKDSSAISIAVKRVNLDAPLHMRLLCTMVIKVPGELSLTDEESDFEDLPRINSNK